MELVSRRFTGVRILVGADCLGFAEPSRTAGFGGFGCVFSLHCFGATMFQAVVEACFGTLQVGKSL